MPYYTKKLALELYVPAAVEADSAEVAQKLIDGFDFDGKTIKVRSKYIFEIMLFEEDMPVEISKEQYRKTEMKFIR